MYTLHGCPLILRVSPILLDVSRTLLRNRRRRRGETWPPKLPATAALNGLSFSNSISRSRGGGGLKRGIAQMSAYIHHTFVVQPNPSLPPSHPDPPQGFPNFVLQLPSWLLETFPRGIHKVCPPKFGIFILDESPNGIMVSMLVQWNES